MGNSTRKKTLTKQQKMRRKSLQIKRIEVSLNAEIKGDTLIADHLGELPRGAKSDYIRVALLNQIAYDTRTTDTDEELRDLRNTVEVLEDQNEVLIDMVRELTAAIHELSQRKIEVQMVQAAQISVGPATPKPDSLPEILQSSGLDMSRPRPRPKLKRGPVADQSLDVTDEFDAVALGKLMARSIKNAQPGRGSGD
jgi:capsule polysaccharide export protein KpsE/RkpR